MKKQILDAASVTALDGTWTLKLSREYSHSVETVWSVLTEPKHLKQWAPFVTDRPLYTEGELSLSMIDGESVETFSSSVLEVVAPHLLVYTWGDDLLRWELEAIPTGTKLTLHHTVFEKDWIAKVAAGWQICFEGVERLLAGQPVGNIIGIAAMDHGWQELHDQYAEKLMI